MFNIIAIPLIFYFLISLSIALISQKLFFAIAALNTFLIAVFLISFANAGGDSSLGASVVRYLFRWYAPASIAVLILAAIVSNYLKK